MRRAGLGYLLLLLAAALLIVEAVSVLARFAMFTGASEAVPISRWRWTDLLRLLGVMVFAAAGYRILLGARRRHNGTA